MPAQRFDPYTGAMRYHSRVRRDFGFLRCPSAYEAIQAGAFLALMVLAVYGATLARVALEHQP